MECLAAGDCLGGTRCCSVGDGSICRHDCSPGAPICQSDDDCAGASVVGAEGERYDVSECSKMPINLGGEVSIRDCIMPQ